MEDRPITTYRMSQLNGETGRLVACGVWVRLGFVGANAVAVGVIQLFGSDASPMSSLAWVTAGAALTAFSWRRAHAALGDADESETPTGASSAAGGIRSVAGA